MLGQIFACAPSSYQKRGTHACMSIARRPQTRNPSTKGPRRKVRPALPFQSRPWFGVPGKLSIFDTHQASCRASPYAVAVPGRCQSHTCRRRLCLLQEGHYTGSPDGPSEHAASLKTVGAGLQQRLCPWECPPPRSVKPGKVNAEKPASRTTADALQASTVDLEMPSQCF